jgi:hypothetical protein
VCVCVCVCVIVCVCVCVCVCVVCVCVYRGSEAAGAWAAGAATDEGALLAGADGGGCVGAREQDSSWCATTA